VPDMSREIELIMRDQRQRHYVDASTCLLQSTRRGQMSGEVRPRSGCLLCSSSMIQGDCVTTCALGRRQA
jgi:hypothetical protein